VSEVLYITGTDTGVGKTIATAALASRFSARGSRVAVFKPTQAGLEDGLGDADTVAHLGGAAVHVSEGIRLAFPMAPVFAARREGVALPGTAVHAASVRRLGEQYDVVLVEGAGGLLVELDGAGATLLDIAAAAPGRFIVVCRAGLGTLNHTALTLEALNARRAPVAGLLIGAWPEDPSPIEEDNRAYFQTGDVPLLGVIPAGAGRLAPEEFRLRASAGWLSL
jgi:dethiobiotin synthetase